MLGFGGAAMMMMMTMVVMMVRNRINKRGRLASGEDAAGERTIFETIGGRA